MSPSSSWCRLTVRSTPRVDDPREFQTILYFSLRSLWGDLEPYSCLIEVDRTDEDQGTSSLSSSYLTVQCPTDSVTAVRAALTMVSPPPYLESTFYRFDVVDLQENTSPPAPRSKR